MTYSIVARDTQTGLSGVAVQTAMFAAGASVPLARAAIGVWALVCHEPARRSRAWEQVDISPADSGNSRRGHFAAERQAHGIRERQHGPGAGIAVIPADHRCPVPDVPGRT